MKLLNQIAHLLICTLSAIIGYNVNVANHSCCPAFWAGVDFLFWPIAWMKWLILEQINTSIIKTSFSFFFN